MDSEKARSQRRGTKNKTYTRASVCSADSLLNNQASLPLGVIHSLRIKIPSGVKTSFPPTRSLWNNTRRGQIEIPGLMVSRLESTINCV